MKQLATTTGDSIRKIYDDVSLENPTVAAKIDFPRMEAAMRKRREKITPKNPSNFAECVQLLEGAVIYNKYLQHTILEEGEGALIFATPKGLAKANSPDVKVSMTDATFKCCTKKECTGIYQMLIFHIIIHRLPSPIMHAPMTAKTDQLYIEVLIWLKQECPQLEPENISMDFEVGEMNAGEEVFHVVPTGCDFHYNQAILRKIGKNGLKKICPKMLNSKLGCIR